MAPDCRAARKCGSSGIESSDTKAYTSRFTLPAAHSSPTSGPPQLTTVRSSTSVRRSARTTDIGLRREPHPPMPMVIPERSSATASSSVQRLSFTQVSCRVSRFSTKASRCSSATPERLSSKVKPCS